MKPDELKELVQVMNPDKEEGKLVLITRYGAGKVEELLPAHIKAVKDPSRAWHEQTSRGGNGPR